MTQATTRLRELAAVSGWRWALTMAADQLSPVSPFRLWPIWRVSPDRLQLQVDALLAGFGQPESARNHTVRHLMYADLRGIDSHGCAMLKAYQHEAERGRLKLDGRPEVTHERPNSAVINANHSLGHEPANMATSLAIDKAKASGFGVIAVRNSGHFGAAGAYAEAVAKQGLIGLATTTTAAPSLVPTHAREPRLGTNPLAFAAPVEGSEPFLLDMATTVVARGRLVTRWRQGRRSPAAWAYTTNSRRAFEGRRLRPLGGSVDGSSHKGYGLAIMVEILAGMLTGAYAGELAAEADKPIGHLFLAIDPGVVDQQNGFPGRVAALLDALRASKPAGDRAVDVPGDPERRILQDREARGIPMPRQLIEGLRELAARAGTDFVLEPISADGGGIS